MRFATTCLVLLLAGCGSIEYGRSERGRAEVQPAPAASQVVVCSGRERIRLSDMRIDGGQGVAIHASGHCRVDIRGSIITGQPAIYATDHARLRFRGCRIRGQMITEGHARVATPGSRVEM